jgi:hypothetical protein
VRYFAKPILIACVSIVILFSLSILVINIYLQSEQVHTKLQDAASHIAGSPVKVDHAYYTPWAGLHISGISMPCPGNSKVPLLTVPNINVRFSIISLLKVKPIVKSVYISSPSVAWTLAASPQVPPNASAIAAMALPAAGLSVANSTPTLPNPINTVFRIPSVIVESIRVHNGRVLFYKPDGSIAGTLENIKAQCALGPERDLIGDFRIGSAKWQNALQLEKITGRFFADRDHLLISQVHGLWAEGTVDAGLFADISDDHGFDGWATVEHVSLKKLAELAGMNGSGKKGDLFANALLKGTAGHPETFEGSANASLLDARVEPIDVIKQIGELFRIEELRMVDLKTAETELAIHGGEITIEKLVFASDNIVLDALGKSTLDGQLALDARFHVSDKIRSQTRGLVGKNFQPSDQEGFVYMPFKVGGTFSHPKTDLLDKLVGTRIGQDIGGFLKNLLGPPQKQKKKKPSEVEPAASPSGGN